MWCWRRMEKISRTDRVKNKGVLLRVKKEEKIVRTYGKWKDWYSLQRNYVLE
jgi:hypothetical protein